MPYQLQFGAVFQQWEMIVQGLWLTAQLSVAAIAIGTTVGITAATARAMNGPAVRLLIDTYVEIIRNTPFLIQLFIVYFGLPALGIRVNATTAALIGMSVNLGAYSTEILRAGIDSIHRSQLEAGEALGMTGLQVFRHVVLMPALARVYPALCSQFVLMMLASSVCSAISTQELAASAAQIESQTFRSFEVYILVTFVYLGLAFLLRGLLALAGVALFARRDPSDAPWFPLPRFWGGRKPAWRKP